MDHKIPLDVLQTYDVPDVCQYLDQHGEDGTHTDDEIDAFLSKLDQEDVADVQRPPDDAWFDFPGLKTLYTHAKRSWHDSPFARNLAEIFENISPRVSIKKCICVDLGQPSSRFLTWTIDGVPETFDDLEYLDRHKFAREARLTLLEPRLLKGESRHSIPLLHLATIKWMAEHFANVQSDDRPQVFVHGPRFNETDVALFRSLGVSILGNPEALSQVDESTLVYAPRSPPSEWPNTLTNTSAQIIVGNDVRARLDRKPIPGEAFAYKRTSYGLRANQSLEIEPRQRQALERHLECHHSAPTNADERFDRAFANTAVYWKKSEVAPRL